MIMVRWRKFWAGALGTAALLGWGMVNSATAAPTVAAILQFAPRQSGIKVTTPTKEEQKDCKVKLVRAGKGSGWLLSNDKGPVRRFFDRNADNRIDSWSYFKDGVEVYREIDSNFNGKPDNYRWLNEAGQKWGVDQNEDGVIDNWTAISPEEVSQEILAAIREDDYARFQAVMLNDKEIKALDLLDAEKEKFETMAKEAKEGFDKTVAKLKDLKSARWIHLETDAPRCRPAAAGESSVDLVHHARGAILYDLGEKNDWIQTGVMVKVSGSAWRIVGAPTPGHQVARNPNAGTGTGANKKLQELLTALSKHDEGTGEVDPTPGPKPKVMQHNLKRADLIEQIIAEVKPSEREGWIRQVADSLSTAAQNSPADDTRARKRLKSLEKQISTAMPRSNLAAYITFRGMQAGYAARLSNPKGDFTKIQEEWIEELAEFVGEYPKAPDTADALLQLGMVSEFLNKETAANKWYRQLAKDFGKADIAGKARGALNRLNAEGEKMTLSGPKMEGGTFSMDDVKGKVTIVYYWASWNQQTVGDFAKIKLMMDNFKSKDVAVVCINLDDELSKAKAFLTKSPVPAVHLFDKGGLDSSYATQYGIMVLPHLFLVDQKGKVVSRTIQVNALERQINKLLK